MAITQLHPNALPGIPRTFIAKDPGVVVDFTAQETLTLAAIDRYATTPEVIIRTVTPALNRRTTEVK